MTRKRVFISGPIAKGNLADNVNNATKAFVDLADAGFAPFCPHWSVYAKESTSQGSDCLCVGTASGNETIDYETWLDIDFSWIRASHAVLRLPGESSGSDKELRFAEDHGIPIFYSIDELIAWRKFTI
jgi:hypothetical protein